MASQIPYGARALPISPRIATSSGFNLARGGGRQQADAKTAQTQSLVLRKLSVMQPIRHKTSPLLLAFIASVVLLCVHVPTAHAESPTGIDGYIWLDVNDEPLPYQDHATIQEWLRSANVISREKVGRGIAGVEKLVLEYEGIRFHAAFRSVDVTVRKAAPRGVERSTKKYRDAAIFESAAYELSELLGIGRVPPVVERSIDGQNGTVQIWMEGTRPEVVLKQEDQLHPPDISRWKQQKQIMYVFDNLVCNSDRNQGNLLIDRGWNIWFIDHTRAFKRSSKLIYLDKLTSCDRRLWSSLRDINDETIQQRLEPYLESREITKLLTRRRTLVRRIQGMIDKQSEETVLFDLRPPTGERANWSD